MSEPTTRLDEVTVNSNGAFRPKVSKTDFTQLHPKGYLNAYGNPFVDTVLDFTQHDECTKGASIQQPASVSIVEIQGVVKLQKA